MNQTVPVVGEVSISCRVEMEADGMRARGCKREWGSESGLEVLRCSLERRPLPLRARFLVPVPSDATSAAGRLSGGFSLRP